jgi:co-chaperonin GroES (HSP10)
MSEIKYEKITPVFDRMIIKPINYNDSKDDNGQSLLRDIAQKKILEQPIEDFETTKAMNNCGIVCSVSMDCRWVSANDIVFWGKHSGMEIMIESLVHIMIRESDVLFILK